MSSFTTLICTYNRHELLRESLYALIEETAEKPDQIVVVNGGDEHADEVVYSFFNQFPKSASRNASTRLITGHRLSIEVKLIKTVNKNLAASRNIGLRHCDGDIIAMTDDDAEVFPDWVTQMKRTHYKHPEAGAIGGTVLGTNRESLVGKVADLITFPSWSEPRYVHTLPGVNISYKREAIADLAQDETLFRGEDVDFNWRVKQLGYEIYFDPAIKVHHHHRPTSRGFLNQHYMYGRAYYLVRKKWPKMYCIYPHSLRHFRDVFKAINTIAGIFYQPFLDIRKLDNFSDRLRALPLLLAAGFAWRLGMLIQRIKGTTD